MSSQLINERDLPRQREGRMFITVGTERYLFAEVVEFTAEGVINQQTVNRMDATRAVTRATSTQVTGSITYYDASDLGIDYFIEIQEGREEPYVEIEEYAEDAATTLGTRILVYENVKFGNVGLSAFNINTEELRTKPIAFTADKVIKEQGYNPYRTVAK